MATPRENIERELRNALAAQDKAIGALNFDEAARIHQHVLDLVDDLSNILAP